MRKYQLFIILIFCLALFQDGLAQTEALINQPREKGYIVLAAGDTLRGFIYNSSNKKLYKRIRFQESLNQPLRDYDPSSVKAFYLTESRQMFISGDLLKKFKKKGNYAGSEGVFLKVIVRGSASLYQYAGAHTVYFVTTDQRAEVLEKGTKQKTQVGTNYYSVETKPYQKTLQRLFSDCLKDTFSLAFSSFALTSIVERYNTCKGVQSYTFGKQRSKVFIGFTAGMNDSMLKFEDKNAVVPPYGFPLLAPHGSYDLTPITQETYKSRTFYGGLTISLYPNWNKHVSVNAQLAYAKRKWNAGRVDLNLNYVEIPLCIRYNFNIGNKVQPVVGGGFNTALSVKPNNNDDTYKWNFHRESVKLGQDAFPAVFQVTMPVILENEFNPNFFFPFALVGLDIINTNSIISLDFRIGFRGSLTKSPMYESQVTSNTFLISYTPFWKK